MSTWLGTGEGIVAVAIPVVGLIYTYATNRRSQFDRVLTLVAESGTPPLSEDRHVIGMVFEPTFRFRPDQPITLTDTEIKSLFNVLWYAQRVSAMYRSLSPLWPWRITRTQALLLDSLSDAVGTWESYLRVVDRENVQIGESANALVYLTGEYRKLRRQRAKRRSPS